MRSVQKVSSRALWKIDTVIEEVIRYKNHCTRNNDALVPFKVGTLEPHTGLPVSLPLFKTLYKIICWITISCPIISSWISLMVWNLYLSKVILVLGKDRSHRAPSLGCRATEEPGWFDVSSKNCAWDRIHELARCSDEAANHQLPLAVAIFVVLHH